MGQCILWAKKLLHISNIRPEITIGCLHKSVCGIDMRGSVFWQCERGVFRRELGTTANLELGTTAGCIPFALPLPFPHPPPSALESRNKISAISLQCKLYIIRPWRIPATRHDLNFFFLPKQDPEFFFQNFRVQGSSYICYYKSRIFSSTMLWMKRCPQKIMKNYQIPPDLIQK